jgi:LysM domain
MRLLNRPFLHLISVDGSLDLKLAMGDGPATPTAGMAGTEVVSRRRRKGMTTFAGLEPFQQDVPVLLDGYADNESIERQLGKLEEFGGATRFKALGPIHHPGEIYRMGDEPEYGEAIRSSDGTLVRQRLTLKLMEDVPVAAGKRGSGKKVGKLGSAIPLTYTTVAGDTLGKIANKLWREWDRWKEIGVLNGIDDPHRVLKAGRTLILPGDTARRVSPAFPLG